ncbi:MAG: indole-3-glycerol phosphate synthase TrpC [Oligoflexales bacterium]
MSEILKKIIAHKKQEVQERKKKQPFDLLKAMASGLNDPKNFLSVMRKKSEKAKVIAECKKKSPSKGILCDPYNPVYLAQAYEKGGATAISCLTDQEFFGGNLADLRSVAASTSIPVLRKDFIIDEYQIWETRVYGGDSFLLLSGVLDFAEIQYFCEIGRELGMEPLLESHSKDELKEALKTDAEIIGVNCRDLNSFKVSLEQAKNLMPFLKDHAGDRIFVCESGITSKSDLEEMQEAGYQHFLVGEYLVKSQDQEECLRKLIN